MLIRLAGFVTIEQPGLAARSLSSAQAQVAFARLTLERVNGTGRDQLADTVWPDGLPDTWASALRSVVSRVRAFAAGATEPVDAVLISQAGRYFLRFPADCVVDVEQAEVDVRLAGQALAAGAYGDARHHAMAAVSCLTCPFLPDHEGDWVTEVRERLNEQLVCALETASLAASALGEVTDALRLADEAVRRTPLRESAHRARMAAHVAAGNRAEALRSYNDLRRALAEELGVDPAPETQAAYLELLSSPAASPQRSAKPAVSASGTPFVGRSAQLTALSEAWASVHGGGSRFAVISGERGIGKTRLATVAARRVSVAGGVVLFGRCDPSSTIPFQPLVEALTDFVAATPDDAMPNLSQRLRHGLSVLVAAGQQSQPVTAAPPVELLTAIADTLGELTREKPILLVIDDLDQADERCLVLLRHVLQRRNLSSLLIIGTVTATEPGAEPITAAIRGLDIESALVRLPLVGLAEPDVLALIRQAMPDGGDRMPTAHQIMVDTAGNPLLIQEVLRSCRDDQAVWPASVPVAIHEYAVEALAGLDGAAANLARVAAVAGPSFDLELLADAAEIDFNEAMDCLDTLLLRGIVVAQPAPSTASAPRRYRFTHDIVRRAICERINDARRGQLHGRLADAIELRRGDVLDQYSIAMARHRFAAAAPGGDPRAVHWGWQAATLAGDHHSSAEAVRLHEQALRHVPPEDQELRAQAVTALGLAQLRAGVGGSARTLLDGAIRALHCGRPDVAAQAVVGLADAIARPPGTPAHELTSEAEALLETLVPDNTHATIGSTGRHPIDPVTAARLLVRQARLGRTVVPGAATSAAANALVEQLRQLSGLDQARFRLILAGEALTLATATDDRSLEIFAAHHRAMAADSLDDLAARDAALGALAHARAAADRTDFTSALLAEHAVAIAITEGRFTDAMVATKLVDQAMPSGPLDITPAPGSMASRQLVVTGWLRVGGWPSNGAAMLTPDVDTEAALVAVIRGDRGRSHLRLRAIATGVEPLPAGDQWPHLAGVLALGAVRLNDPATAEAVRGMLTPYASMVCGVGYRSFVGPVSFHLGRLAMVVGDWAAAERHLVAALSQLGARHARPWIALTQQALAETLLRRSRGSDYGWISSLRDEAGRTLASLGVPVGAG